MPKITNKIQHNLGQDEAIKRLKDACEYAHNISDLHETWDGNVLVFSTSIQGINISGKIKVTEDSVCLNGKIPLIAFPFKSWIPNILRNALKKRKNVIETSGNVSQSPLILFLHIPKAGGTTLGEFIYNQCKNGDDAEPGLVQNGVFFMSDGFFRESETTYSPQIQNLLCRHDLRAVIGHFAFGIHEIIDKPVKYVTILRDPVKRVISLYHFLKLESRMSLKDFINSYSCREIDNDQTRRIAGVNPVIGEVTKEDLETAKTNLRRYFAVVGTTERFDETLFLLKRKLNWTKEVRSFPRNVTKKKAGATDDSDIKAIENFNPFDIELHQFANQLMDEMIAKQSEIFPGNA